MSERNRGEAVSGELNSANASGGATITLRTHGSPSVVRSIGANERFVVTDVAVVTAPGGDVRVFLSADGSLNDGETVVRGTFAANGGMVRSFITPISGAAGAVPRVIAPTGAIDVQITGRVVRA